MSNNLEEKLAKKIKKNLYGKSQSIKAIFPAGFGKTALDEVEFILKKLWYPQKFISECFLLKNEIRIKNIHMFSIIELMMRSQCLADIRLIIYEGKTFGNNAFEKKCRNIEWDFYINKKIAIKIKVDSIASKAFHETALKEKLSEILQSHVGEIVQNDVVETTCIYADLYKDKLTLSISLAGNQLYKRGYREQLSASAPLREDAAFCCIKNSLVFSKKLSEAFFPDSVVIPFSGTGTFAFEYLQYDKHVYPVLLGREYILQKMPFFREDAFNYLVKKARENCLLNAPIAENNLQIISIDSSQNANKTLLNNFNYFKDALIKNNLILNTVVKNIQDDFIKMDIDPDFFEDKNIFMPLNPPYGIRLGKHDDPVILYKNIAKKLNNIKKLIKNRQKHLAGFILCPTEEAWTSFVNQLVAVKTETYHFTHGGMDVRVCQFFV